MSAAELCKMLKLKKTIDFENVPYQESKYEPLLLHNDTEQTLNVSFISESSEFTAAPSQLQLFPNATNTVQFCCKPISLGQRQGQIIVSINETQVHTITMKALSYELQVEISPNVIDKFQNTLVTQTEACETRILNKSEHPFSFQIMRFPMPQNGQDPLFSDPQFKMNPLQGKIYPQGQSIVSCQFTPESAGLKETSAWLQCQGRISRIPIKIKAQGVAPDVDFDYDVLEFSKLVIGSQARQSFELQNFSKIQVEFSIVQKLVQDNEPILEFSQSRGVIPASAAITIQANITPQILGTFNQKIEFIIIGCLNSMILEINSETIPPEIQLTTDLDAITETKPGDQFLDFGVVPYGFGSQKEIHLTNLSLVEQEISLFIQPLVNSAQQILMAKDFTVAPTKILLPVSDRKSINVTLFPKNNQEVYSDFYLNIYSTCQTTPLTRCLLKASVINAKFRLEPEVYELKECFVGFPHKIRLQVKNISPVIGRWLFPPQELNEACIIQSDIQTGVLAPNSTVIINCTMIPRAPGNLVVPITFLSDVGDKQSMQCMVQYQAKGPVLATSTESIKYTNVRVLEKVSKTFVLTGMSLSSANVRIATAKPGSFFTIPEEFQRFMIKQGEQKQVTVDFTPNSQGNISDALLCYYELANPACDVSEEVKKEISSVIKIKVSGDAKGTSLICPDQDFVTKPTLSCGVYFTTEQLIKQIRIENRGQDIQSLQWQPVFQKGGEPNMLTMESTKQTIEPGKYFVFTFIGKSQKPLAMRSEAWQLRTSVAGKQTDTAFVVNLEYSFIDPAVAVIDEKDNPIQLGQQCQPLNFVYEEFPILGDPQLFFDTDYEQIVEKIIEVGDKQLLYRNDQTVRKIKIVNNTIPGCRVQIVIKEPFFIKLLDEQGNQIYSLPEELPTRKSPSRQFESFVLKQQNDYQFVEVGIDDSFCLEDRISKSISGLVQIRLLPLDQTPGNVPMIKIPLQARASFPSVEFRACSQAFINQQQNVAYSDYFEKLDAIAAIDFGSTVPGTPVNRYIFVKNVTRFPIQLQWQLQNLNIENCTFDITPNNIQQAIKPAQIVMFVCKFQCVSGEKPSMKISNVGAVCELFGGPVYEYKVAAQISNMAVDIQPSLINLGEISFCGESQQSIFIQNMSDVETHIQVKVKQQSLAFIKKINDAVIKMEDAPQWDFTLNGGQKKEMKFTFAPRVSGKFYLPIYVKIGHLEEIVIPVSAQAYVESMNLSLNLNVIPRAENILPWTSQITKIPPYLAFLKAASVLHPIEAKQINATSTLDKIVHANGSVSVDGEFYEYKDDKCVEDLQKDPLVVAKADELVLIFIEKFKLMNQESTSTVVSKARSRMDKTRILEFINENPFGVMKTVSDIPRYPILCQYSTEFPACQRQSTTSQTITLTNTGSTSLTINFERRYYFPFGITIEPEKVSRLPQGESVQIQITYTPDAESQLGLQKFLIPFIYKTGAISYLMCKTQVTVPTVKPVNLMALASNFEEFPVKADEQQQILHFGKCYFGRSLRFNVQLQNPSQIQANFSCDLSGGSTKLYQLNSRKEIDLKEKIQHKLEIFQIGSLNYSIPPNSDSSITVTFKPKDCMQPQFGHGIQFRGELKFAIKTGVESISRITIFCIGIGYYPQIKASTTNIMIPPVFPREISSRFATTLLNNESDEPLEVYLKEFDQIHVIEDILINIIAQSDGTSSIKRVKGGNQSMWEHQYNDFAEGGAIMSETLIKRLNDLGLERLTTFLLDKYDKLNGQNKMIKAFIEQLRTADASKAPKPIQQHDNDNKLSAISTLAKRKLNSDKQKAQDFDLLFNNDDFSYQLTSDEQNILKYGKVALSVFDGKSYRIAPTDTFFSNVPFLVYIIHGAPLSGKTQLCRKIQQLLIVNGKKLPLIQFDLILGQQSVTFLKYKKLYDDEQAAAAAGAKQKKGQTNEVIDPTAFMSKPEYLQELAQEFVSKLEQLYQDSADEFLKLGFIMDGLQSQYIKKLSNFDVVFKIIIDSFMKPTCYTKQVATARIAIYPIITDLPPLLARKRSIEAIVAEYREAESELQRCDDNVQRQELEERIKLAKAAMIDAKQFYDTEDKVSDLTIDSDLSIITKHYMKINACEDIIGKNQQEYLNSLKDLDKLITTIKEQVLQSHKEYIQKQMSDTDKNPDQLAYDKIQEELIITRNELQQVKKADIKKVQQKYDELVEKLSEAEKKLPKNPIDSLPQENLFQLIEIFVPECSILDKDEFNRVFHRILIRYADVLEKFTKVLIDGRKEADQSSEKIMRSSFIEEMLCVQAMDPISLKDLKAKLDIQDDNIVKILDDSNSLLATLNQVSQDISTKDIFQIMPINSEFMNFISQQQQKADVLKLEIEQANQNPKLQKQQQVELAQKQKEYQSIIDLITSAYSEHTRPIQAGFARWIIPAKSQVQLTFRVFSSIIKKETQQFTLKSRTTELEIPLEITAQCDWPHIIKDFGKILPAKKSILDFGFIRSGLQAPDIFSRQLTEQDFITNKMPYDDLCKTLSHKSSPFTQAHVKNVLIENDSVFEVKVGLILDSQLNNDQPNVAFDKMFEENQELQDKKRDDKDKKDKDKGDKPKWNTFNVYPNKLLLQPGEKQYVFITAFPDQATTSQGSLFIQVHKNPEMITIPIKCCGVVPQLKYKLPECQPELLPCQRIANDISELSLKMQGLSAENIKKQKKPDQKKPGDAKDQSIIYIPRVSFKNSQIVELQITNPINLPVSVQYQPSFTEEAVVQMAQVLKLDELNKQLKIDEITVKKGQNAEVQQQLITQTLKIINTKFILQANETKTIKVEFQAKDQTILVFPGRLIANQYTQRQEPASCEIPSLNNLSQNYKTPVLNLPLIFVAEAHNVDAFVAVQQILPSPDRIPAKNLTYNIQTPSTNMNFGIVKALTHFQAEVVIGNSGPYDIKFSCEINKDFENQLQIIQPTDQDQKQKKNTDQAFQVVKETSGIIQSPNPGDKSQKGDRTAIDPKQYQKVLKFDFFSSSDTDLQNQPVSSIIFSDPTTKQVLFKTSLNVTAKVKYSDVNVVPDRSMHFGDMAHGKIQTKQITIENSGPFPTTFIIEKLSTVVKRYQITGEISQFTEQYQTVFNNVKVDQNKLVQLGYLQDQYVQSKLKDQKKDAKDVKNAPKSILQAGPFSVTPNTFILQPDQKQQITVTYNSLYTKDYREVFVIDYSNRQFEEPVGTKVSDIIIEGIEQEFVSDYQKNPELQQFYPYTKKLFDEINNLKIIKYGIMGNSQVPGISPQPTDLFEEQQIVNQSIADPMQVVDGSQFSILANQLCVGSCQLNSIVKERIKLHNPHSVECNVAIIITPRVDGWEILQTEILGDNSQKIIANFDPTQKKVIEEKTKKDDKLKEVSIQNDDEAWKVDNQFIQIGPHESKYITIQYQPTKQVVSKSRLLAISVDSWFRVNEMMKKAEKGDTEKTFFQMIMKGLTEKDLKSAIIDFKLMGIGVLPEVVFGPKTVSLQEVLVNDMQNLEKQEIFVKNVGRVASKFSIQVKAKRQQDQDMFQLIKHSNSNVDPETRLFTGLKEVKAGETIFFNVSFYANCQLPPETTTIEAVLVAHVMTSEDKFQSVDIPLKVTIVNTTVCALTKSVKDKSYEKFQQDVVQMLFQIPDNPNISQIISNVQQALYEAQCHQTTRQTIIQAMNLFVDKPEYRANIYMNDSVPGCEQVSIVQLINQSVVVQRFEIDKQQQQKLGIEIVPSIGHIGANGKIDLKIKIVQPVVDSDPKLKKPLQTVQRNILFASPLIIRLTSVQLKRYKPQMWDNSQVQISYVTDSQTNRSERKNEILPEPEFEIIPNQQILGKIQREYEELQQNIIKKVKMTPQQQTRFNLLQKIIDNQSTEGAALAASYFIELDLFGSFAQQNLKFFIKTDQTYVQLPIEQKEQQSYLELPFQDTPILQQTLESIFIMNEGLAAPQSDFCNDSASGAFQVDSQLYIYPKPDIYANAIKEQMPQITDIQSLQLILTKFNIAKLGFDKIQQAQYQSKFGGVDQSPYTVKLDIRFEPKIPGQYDEYFVCKAAQSLIHLSSIASLPLCHIECSPTKYLQQVRPASYVTPYIFSNLLASSQKTIKVLQINSIGMGIKTSQCISMLNTISQPYQIQLERLPESSSKIECALTTYQISSAEQLSIKFTYEPDKNSLKQMADEAFYILKIVKFDVKIPILVVGIPKEPDVTLSTNKINFGQISFGSTKQMDITIINREKTSFNYKVSEIKDDVEFKITPSQGIVPANSQVSIQLTCRPSREANMSSLVQIEISKKLIPLQINVKYECFKPKHNLELLAENEVGVPVLIGSLLDLDYGQVFVADHQLRKFKLSNIGQSEIQVAISFALERNIMTQRKDSMELKQALQNISVEADELNNGILTIGPNKVSIISLKFSPKDTMTIDRQFGLVLYFKIPHVSTQRINIYAKSLRPGLHASAQDIDFGTVITDLIPELCQVKSIKFTNMDKQPLNLEYISESQDFCVTTPPQQQPIKPGQSLEVQVRFQPVFAQKFQAYLQVTVNGLYKLKYQMKGTAVQHNIGIQNKTLQMGAIMVGSSPICKQLEISNNSQAVTIVEVVMSPDVEKPKGLFVSIAQKENATEQMAKMQEMIVNWEARTLKKKYLESLVKRISIQPNTSACLIAIFSPTTRCPQFQIPCNLLVEGCHSIERMFTIDGSGIGASSRIMTSTVDLPPCIENSFVQQEFQLENTGDVPITFIIDMPPKNVVKRQLIQLFEKKIIDIRPLSMQIIPGQIFNISIKFSPPAGFQAGIYEIPNIPIDYEHLGQRKNIGSFTLRCICESQTKFNTVATILLNFTCPSRQSDTKSTKVENPTTIPFEVKTVLQGEHSRHFRIPDRLLVPPGGLDFQIQYRPMVQSTQDAPHKTKLVVASPEGGAYIYELTGIASQPLLDGLLTTQEQKTGRQPTIVGKPGAQQQVQKEAVTDNVINIQKIVAYKPMRLQIPLNNWEQSMQRFTISHQFSSNEQENLAGFQYPTFVDVAPNTPPRIVEVIFTAYQLLLFNGFLFFKNEQSGESLKYQFTLECTGVEPLQKQFLETTVRDSLLKAVQIPNGLGKTLVFTPKSNRTDVKFSEDRIKITQKQISAVSKFTFRPLVPCQNQDCVLEYETVLITDENKEVKLASYQVMLQLTANPPRPSSPLKVQADVGKTLQFQISLKNESKEKAIFSAAVTQLSDVSELISVVQAVPSGKKDQFIIDGKRLVQQLNCISLTATEVSAEPGAGFVLNAQFAPKSIGDYLANIAVYNKTGGVWVVPVIGKCTKPPGTGAIGLE